MGDVLEMRCKVGVEVHRFGHHFRVEYRAGRHPSQADPQAALDIDGAFYAWLSVGFHALDWKALYLDLDNDRVLIQPEMVGMSPTTEDTKDHRFLLEAEEYVLALLTEGLVRALGASETAEERTQEVPDPRNIHPHERASRAVAVWHDHGKDAKRLPDLIAIEICDALEGMGMTIADALDEDEDVPREECGDAVRNLIEETLQMWRGEGE